MAVQRVSPPPPSPLPVASEEWSVKSGYLWTLDDPPSAAPPAVVERRPAVTESHANVTVAVSYSRPSYTSRGHTYPSISGTAVFGPVDLGVADGSRYNETVTIPVPAADGAATIEGATLELNLFYNAGQGMLTFTRHGPHGDGGWWFDDEDDFYARVYARAGDPQPWPDYDFRNVEEGSPVTCTSRSDSYGRSTNASVSVTVSNSPVTVELEPAVTLVEFPPVKEIAYLGDYDRNLVDRDGRPFGPFASPSRGAPLRGEALAYLASWTERLAQAASYDEDDMALTRRFPDAVWDTGSTDSAGRPVLAYANGMFGAGWPSPAASPALSLFRLRVLDYQRLRRAAVAPALSASSQDAPDAVYLTYDSVPDPSDPVVPDPPFSGGFRVAASQAAADANLGKWLVPSGQGAPEFSERNAGDASRLARVAAWVASVSPAQPDAALASGGFAPAYSPPQSAGGTASQGPEGMPASDVSALFAASVLSSGKSRCWALTTRLDPFASASGTYDGYVRGSDPLYASGDGPRYPWHLYPAFTYESKAHRVQNYEDMCVDDAEAEAASRAAAAASWAAALEGGHQSVLTFVDGRWQGSEPQEQGDWSCPGVERAWEYASTGLGAHEEYWHRNEYGPVHHVTRVSRVRGADEPAPAGDWRPGGWWVLDYGGAGDLKYAGMNLLRTVSEVPDQSLQGSYPHYPNADVSYGDNAQGVHVAFVSTYAASGVQEKGRFTLEYRSNVPRTVSEIVKTDPLTGETHTSTGLSPLAPGGDRPVPLPSPDHVGVRPVFVAEVELMTRGLVVEERGGNVDGCYGDPQYYAKRLHRDYPSRRRSWTVVGLVPSRAEWARAAGSETGTAQSGSDRYVLGAAGAQGLASFVAQRALAACGLPAYAKTLLGDSPPPYYWFESAPHETFAIDGQRASRPCATHDAAVYHVRHYDDNGDEVDEGGILQTGSWEVAPGEYVLDAEISVDVHLPLCVFESGYCA